MKFIYPIIFALSAIILQACISIPEEAAEISAGKEEAAIYEGAEFHEFEMTPPEKFVSETPPPPSLEEMYAELQYNPHGAALNWIAFTDPVGAIYAGSIRDESVEMTAKLFPNIVAVDNNADAFRHAYFSFRLSQKIGAERAKRFTDAYEISNLNRMGARCMDLWNNREGRRMYLETKKIKTDDKRKLAETNVLNAIKKGRLVLEPFKIRHIKNHSAAQSSAQNSAGSSAGNK